MGERQFYQLDLLDQSRRVAWEQAARRNGEKLSSLIRRVVDTAVDRRPDLLTACPEVEASGDDSGASASPDSEPCRHVVFRVRVLPWGGRVCEGCGDLL